MAKKYVKPTIEDVPLPPKPEGARRSPEEAFERAREVLRKRKGSKDERQSKESG